MEILELVIQYGWQTVTVALAAMILIGCFKPLVRSKVTDADKRHKIYTVMNLGFAAIFAFGLSFAVEGVLSWTHISNLFMSGYALLNILYPLYANLGLQDLLMNIFKGLLEVLTKKILPSVVAQPSEEKVVSTSVSNDIEKMLEDIK